ncbi:MAG TPA: FAD-dependent thymidylate synthase [Sphaerochaeta sp.]|jgi:thymidylate synthase (FAD)|uniref:FAD-dependent thymidylate synthase n=1 Tax=Sphaerochaeta sp. TaxID=1972642 RepID=UPI000E8852DE|nr:FAD-dependent thymidylate synthase [Sphaerochaeta sp.]MDX9823810.1 FAD-dependent thymidylate synthase [Sphaerochaeta sp.]HBO34984.1 FAD-dependent thymidylate synthase [Sphaerochaeta sp.]
MAHCIVAAAEEILDKEFPVLDHGFVRLVDYLGSDERIVQSARVSYGSGTKTYRQDKGLISYLLRNDHTSPFEQVNFTFHVKMPIFVARQWIRHRTGRVNEISGRYSVMSDECYLPDKAHINFQSEDNKQGRTDESVPAELADEVLALLREDQKRSYETYQRLLDLGIARELARVDLPLSLYTEWYWQMDLHNLFHFLQLRLDSHAQYEIRVYAQTILDMVRLVCPMATEAFEEHKLGGKTFSKSELDALKAMLKGEENPLKGRALELFEQKLN